MALRFRQQGAGDSPRRACDQSECIISICPRMTSKGGWSYWSLFEGLRGGGHTICPDLDASMWFSVQGGGGGGGNSLRPYSQQRPMRTNLS